VIQSSNTTLKELLGRSFGVESFHTFTTVSELRRFYIDVAFIIVIVDFYNVETIRFNIMYQPSSLFAMKERNSTLHIIFQ
jgi:hypothetical protein